MQGQKGAAFGGSVPSPETLRGFVRGRCFVIPCSARALCSHALESGPSQPLPLFIFLDLEEIIIFKLSPPCLCCGSNVTVGWRAQEAQGEMGSNCIKSVSFKNQLKSAPPTLPRVSYFFQPRTPAGQTLGNPSLALEWAGLDYQIIPNLDPFTQH